MGAIFFGLAVLFGGGNSVLLLVLNDYFPYFLLMLAGPFGWAGLWLLMTGQPGAQPDGSQAPMWGRIGPRACLAMGLLLGVASVLLVNWG